MGIEGFRQALSNRTDGDWELLAAAAGCDVAVSTVMTGLSAQELEQGSQGLAIAPSTVRERVEAIAAWDPHQLRVLAMDWVRPQDIDRDPWWTAAWIASLRHLKALNAIQYETASVPELAQEAHLVWCQAPPQKRTWEQLCLQAQNEMVFYDEIRLTACGPLYEQTFSAAQIQTAHPLMLRLLRGQTDRLDASGKVAIATLGKHCLQQDPFAAAIILELCQDLGLALVEDICSDLITQIPSIAPQSIIPLAYVLLGNWRVP